MKPIKFTESKIQELVEAFIKKYTEEENISTIPTKSMFRFQSNMTKMMYSELKQRKDTKEIMDRLETFIIMKNEMALTTDFKNSNGIHRYLTAAFKDDGYSSTIQVEQTTPSIVINTHGLDNSLEEKDGTKETDPTIQ